MVQLVVTLMIKVTVQKSFFFFLILFSVYDRYRFFFPLAQSSFVFFSSLRTPLLFPGQYAMCYHIVI